MIGVGFKRNSKITLEASYDDSEFDTAVALGEALARHNKHGVIVFLYHKGRQKVKILKKIKMVRAGFLGLRRKIAVT